MANNWFGGPSTPSDPSTFNYDVEAQKLARQRQAAQALQQLGMQSNQGQFIKSGDFTGFAGGNTVGSTLARALASYLGTNANSNADDQQKQLATDSQDALAYQMDPRNSPAAQRSAAAQTQSEADATMQREANRTVAGGRRVDPNAQDLDSPDVQTSSIEQPTTTVSPLAQAAAKAITSMGSHRKASPPAATPPASKPDALSASDISFMSNALQGKPQPAVRAAPGQSIPAAPNPQQSVLGGPQSFGNGGLSRTLAPPSNLPRPQAPMPSNASTASPAVTSATQPVQTAPSLPAMPQQAQSPMSQPQQMPPQGPAPQPQQPMPQAPQAPDQQSSPVGDPRSMVDQAAASAQPTQADQIAQLQAIARTGPMGQQMATAQMNAMFGSKNGRYKTTVMADPVNGGFIQVVEDTATGATQQKVIGGGGGGKLVTGQTTDANGNRLNVHKDGSTSAMLDDSGKPVVDSSVVARNDDQTQKIGAAVQSNTTAQAAIDTALARNNRILQLYKETETGPIMGHLPNFTAKRQELNALLAQDLFSETRNALAGAGDAGGAPRMAQSEFRYMADNGGLKQTTDAKAAANLIANMNDQLLKQKQALQDFGATLKTTAPGAASAVPARGQQVSAAQYGFK